MRKEVAVLFRHIFCVNKNALEGAPEAFMIRVVCRQDLPDRGCSGLDDEGHENKRPRQFGP